MDINSFLNEHENKTLLRILTCGSVDDGKSTMLGRLLYDSKLIYDDQLNELRKASGKHGTTGVGNIDYALLLDGLKAEREQGITIDVAYRFFTTANRKFIVADCPGHEQYTRNMATGASTADLAIVLVDASKGITDQTKRHLYIVSILGIKHVVIAVNKMDLIHYSKERYADMLISFKDVLASLKLENVQFIPMSARHGENVTKQSDKMPWYNQYYLLEYLEKVDVKSSRNIEDFRFSVQHVIRPNSDFRGFAGSVLSGSVKVGDVVAVLPAFTATTVKRISLNNIDKEEAVAPEAVVIELGDEVDVSSGSMITHACNIPAGSYSFNARLIWMDNTHLHPEQQYILRMGWGGYHKCTVQDIFGIVDMKSYKEQSFKMMEMNEIGTVRIDVNDYVYFDLYERNRATGSFILIDPHTNATVAAGMIIDKQENKKSNGLKRVKIEIEVDVNDLEYFGTVADEDATDFFFDLRLRDYKEIVNFYGVNITELPTTEKEPLWTRYD